VEGLPGGLPGAAARAAWRGGFLADGNASYARRIGPKNRSKDFQRDFSHYHHICSRVPACPGWLSQIRHLFNHWKFSKFLLNPREIKVVTSKSSLVPIRHFFVLSL
jgi:hypothetical protein